jgi:RNA polymerase sigma factor (sigma-70 family)
MKNLELLITSISKKNSVEYHRFFTLFYKKYRPVIYKTVARFTNKSSLDPEELTQEIFIKLHAMPLKYWHNAKTHLNPFVRRFSINYCINRLRMKKHVRFIPIDEAQLAIPDEIVEDHQDLVKELNQLIRNLPKSERKVISLYRKGYKNEIIAKILAYKTGQSDKVAQPHLLKKEIKKVNDYRSRAIRRMKKQHLAS